MDFRSGGWLLVLMAVLVIGIPLARLAWLRGQFAQPALGDGHDIASYGFQLEPLLVERERIVPIGRSMPRDGLPTLDHPPVIVASELPEGEKLSGIRKMTSSTRVIGVSINGQARAYPLWILNWHELVNDTLGGLPILVTYNGPCDSAAVFERRVAGRELNFGFSGLVYNGNLLFYDRPPPGSAGGTDEHTASLWSQLQFRAISGPAAGRGETLTLLPVWLGPWAQWRGMHPASELILPQPGRDRLYKREPYLTYFANDHMQFPVTPLPPRDAPPGWKTPIVATRDQAGGWRVAIVDPLSRGETIPAAQVYAFWFAWFAQHGGPIDIANPQSP
jgi:hypothetical protein